MTKKAGKLSVAFLFDDTLDSTAGVAQYVKTVGAWLSSQGHDVSYLVGQTDIEQWSGGKIYSLSRNLKVRFNGNRLSMPLPGLYRRSISQALDAEKPDVLHVQVPYSPFLAQRVINRASSAAAVVGTFCILPAGWPARLGLRALRLIYGRSLKRIDIMLAVSQAAADFAFEALGVKSFVLPNVIDLKNFKSKKIIQTSETRQRIVFLGRLVERKGALELLKAFRLLHKSQPAVELVIAGAGPYLAELKAYAAKYRLTEIVDFPGFIDESKKAELLATADIACFPSLGGESFGISLIEAMAVSRGVVVGGDNPGYRSVLGDQPKLLIKPYNTEAFAQRMAELLNDDSLRQGLHDWQISNVKQYDVAVVGPKLEQCYRRAIAKRRASR